MSGRFQNVHVGETYVYQPSPMDRWARSPISPGDIVRVTWVSGFDEDEDEYAGCNVERVRDGKFMGYIHCASLRPIARAR